MTISLDSIESRQWIRTPLDLRPARRPPRQVGGFRDLARRHLHRRSAPTCPASSRDAEDNESTSFLPGDAESTEVLSRPEELQGGELAPAVIVYRREAGLTAADRAEDRRRRRPADREALPGRGGRRRHRGGGRRVRKVGAGAERRRPPPAGNAARGLRGADHARPGPARATTRPFVGPICSEDGKAAIVTAYLKGDGEADTILDPVQFWRDTVSDPGGGLEVKITGGAGYAADAIEVFESINGTLLLAAVSLVIVLLILIYRSPIFLFIPLVAVIFAEILSRSVGYGISELGVTINGQSSSIMSILVLGAGTDYALLIVARYREELHHTEDRHEAMQAAMTSAGPAVFASAATVIAALLCLTDRQGQRHRRAGPDRRHGRGLRRALDAHAAARAAHDLRPPRLLALRAAHAGAGPERGRAAPARLGPAHRRRLALRRAAARGRPRACWSPSCCCRS